MLPFDLLFTDVARRESCSIELLDARSRQPSIGYGFEPARQPFEDEPQIMLDPLNPQSELSDQIETMFAELIEQDASVREGFVRHYEQWKRVVDDPTHPAQRTLRGVSSSAAGMGRVASAAPRGPAPNQRCDCRSGKKYKNCCGRGDAVDVAQKL